MLIAVRKGIAMGEVEPVADSRRIGAECMVAIEIDLHTLDAENRSAVEADMGVAVHRDVAIVAVFEIAKGTAPIVGGSVVAIVAVVVPTVVVADVEAQVAGIALEVVAMVVAEDRAVAVGT